MAEDTTKAAVNPTSREARDEARAEAEQARERGYRVESWNGLPKYCSVFDQFDTMDEQVMIEYVANHRGGFGVYGNSAQAGITQGQRMAATRPGGKKRD